MVSTAAVISGDVQVADFCTFVHEVESFGAAGAEKDFGIAEIARELINSSEACAAGYGHDPSARLGAYSIAVGSPDVGFSAWLQGH